VSTFEQAIRVGRFVAERCAAEFPSRSNYEARRHILPIIERESGFAIELFPFKSILELGRESSLTHQVNEYRVARACLYGVLFRWNAAARASIHFWHSLNRCYRRFVVCKEAAHLLCDLDPSDFTSETDELISFIMTDIPDFPECAESETQTGPIASEGLARVAALEMLMPWSRRDAFYSMEAAGLSHLDIATHFSVPQAFVSRRLNQRYRTRVEEINYKIDRESIGSGSLHRL
jgi:hypothetical protein